METRRLAALYTGGREAPGEHPGQAVDRLPKKKPRFRLWMVLIWAGMVLLLYLALRSTPLDQIVPVLRRVGPKQLAVLALVNLVFLHVVNLRWWLILRSLGWRVSLLSLAVYRLAGFGVSYFTPGPQFGGEPLQVSLLHRRKAVPLAEAISSVFLDRLVDLLANFTFLVMGSLVILFGGVAGMPLGKGIWLVSLGLLFFPAGHLLQLRSGKRPVTWLLEGIFRRLSWPPLNKAREIAASAEGQIAAVVRQKPLVLAQILALSVLAWAGALLEFWLCLRFLGSEAGLVETVSALTVARLAFLLPFPGGLGALEASQILAAQWLGWGAAFGLALSLVVRARDLVLAISGLVLTGHAYRWFLFKEPADTERSE